MEYHWHASHCANFGLDKDQTKIITYGAFDGMIVESSITKFYENAAKISEPLRIVNSAVSSLSQPVINPIIESYMEREI